MKKLIPVFALFALALTARAGDTSLVAKALSNDTIKACVQAAKEPGYEIQSSVTVTGICFVSGQTSRVDFFKAMRCNDAGNNGPCPKPAAQLVASAEFGCDNELVSAMCY